MRRGTQTTPVTRQNKALLTNVKILDFRVICIIFVSVTFKPLQRPKKEKQQIDLMACSADPEHVLKAKG